MSIVKSLVKQYEWVVATLESGPSAPALLTRLFVGYFFVETGLGKVQNLDAMTQRFIEWGIPAPAFNAALSGYTELIAGVLIVIGLATRLACVPMIINMIVAVVTVKLRGVAGLSDFVELDEPLYALSFLWLLFVGPGKVSLDYQLFRKRHATRALETYPSTTRVA
jgi:putative oxidoreductase